MAEGLPRGELEGPVRAAPRRRGGLLHRALALLAAVLFGTGSASAAQRAVGVLYDDSRSMSSPPSKWIGANFSLQVTSALLADGDEFYLVKMNAQPAATRFDVPGGVDALLGSLQRENAPDGGTPYAGVDVLLEALRSSSAAEKWLVILTDGGFDGFGLELAQEQFDRIVRPLGIKVVYLEIGNAAKSDAARFWREAAGATLAEAPSGRDIPPRMEEIAALLTGRDPEGVALKRSGAELSVSSKFPLRGLVVLVQGRSGARVETAVTGTRPMSIRSHQIRSRVALDDIPRHANVAHLLAQDGIAAGEDVARIRFSSAVNRDRVKVYPEVAARMEVVLLGADGNPLGKDAEGFFSVCSGEPVTLRTRLLGIDGKPVTVGRSDLDSFEVGYQPHTGGLQRSTIGKNQESFDATITPSDEVRIVPFARYPAYFNYQGEILNLRPLVCNRSVTVVLETQLNADLMWSARVDELEQAPPLRFGVTIDGQPVSQAELQSWTWHEEGAGLWERRIEGGKILLYPKSGCCALFWSRPVAHRGQVAFVRLTTGNPRDRVTLAAPVQYEWRLPEGVFGRLWWLYGCPLAVAAAILLTMIYLRRILFIKERFGRRAKVHIKIGRTTTGRRLVRGRDLPSRWLWPSLRETRNIKGYRFLAVGRGGDAVLLSGKGLTERHEIIGSHWQFDAARQQRREPQVDAKLADRATVRLRNAGQWNKFEHQLHYARLGQEAQWPPE